ncbi:MAG: VanZ family protein [Clostridia bacterium]|nr:VanZ family protein [Clostridia bacterium]
MLAISFLSAELAFAAVWLLVRISVWKRQNSIDWKREAVLLMMYLNLAVIIRFVFFPRDLVDGRVQPLIFEAAAVFPFRINLIPLVHLFDYDRIRDIIWNVVGNMVMFIPSGIVLPIIYRQLNSFWKVVAAGAVISLCTELLQLPFPSRASDIDDLILNTLGVAVGYGIYAACKRLKR